MPELINSSIMYCKVDLSTLGSISLSSTLVAARNYVPSPAAGMAAFLIFITNYHYFLSQL
jgi:hypothetical protein